MAKYRVSSKKLQSLEKIFRADIRALKKKGIKFDMSNSAYPEDDRFVPTTDDQDQCAACLVAAHVICRKIVPRDLDNDIRAAATDLKVKLEWLRDLYYAPTPNGPVPLLKAEFPQAVNLAMRLQRYAQQIGA